MTKTLPALRISKVAKIVFLDVDNCINTFKSFPEPYNVENILSQAKASYMSYVVSLTDKEKVPHAVVADYKTLTYNNFAFVKNFRSNPLLVNVPLIAVSKSTVKDVTELLKSGVDDCYCVPFDCRDMKDRIEFLNSYKKLINAADTTQSDVFKIKISPFKRALDISVAGAGLVLMSPILLTTALFIRIESKGPVIYKSKRSGKGFEIFDFLKFRSMYPDADQRLKDLQHLSQYTDGNTFVKIKNDPRITKVGRFIRKFSIDEIPQLINILKGDMSLVGNRPLPLYEAEMLTHEDAAFRFLAPAGLTGLWQVEKRGTNNMSVEERIGLDVKYAKNHSFWYDMKILMRTPGSIIQKENV